MPSPTLPDQDGSKGCAPPASQDRVTDAPHEAARASSPSGSVPTGAAHTPGPWEVLGDDEGCDGIPYIEVSAGECGTPSFKSIAYVQPEFSDPDGWTLTEADWANARLIAAAPELFEAALAAKEILKPCLDEPLRTAFWRLTDAIAKASGK